MYEPRTEGRVAFDTAAFDSAKAAAFEPLPTGRYVAFAESGELFEASNTGTPGYHIIWRVLEGEYAGRRVRQTLWLSQRAIPYSKGALALLGIQTAAQLEQPLPQGIAARIRVVLEPRENGDVFNGVKAISDVHAVSAETIAALDADADAAAEEAANPFHPDAVDAADADAAAASEPAKSRNPTTEPPFASAAVDAVADDDDDEALF